MEWLFQNVDSWAIAFAHYPGKIDNHYPSDKLLQFSRQHAYGFPRVVKQSPIPVASLVLTDGTSNGTAVYIVDGQQQILYTPPASAQVVALRASVLQKLNTQPFHLYTDSQYTARALQVIELVPQIETSNTEVQALFIQIQKNLQARTQPCYIEHIRAHSGLPGPLAQGNFLADAATRQVFYTQEQLAQQSHALHHQNSNSLRKQFHITHEA